MNVKRNQLKGGVVLSYFSKIIQLLVGLFYTPIMIRLLGQSEYGLYNIASSIIAYLGILNFGFGSAYMRFYSRYKVTKEKESVANLNGMFLVIFVALGMVTIIAGIILAFNVELVFGPSLTTKELDTAKILMLILIMNLGVSFPNVVFDMYIQANEHFIFQNVLEIIRQLSSPLFNLFILVAGYGSTGMVIVTTVINIIAEVITMIYCFRKLDMKITFNNFDWKLFREMSTFSFFIFLDMIVAQVNTNTDKTILGRYQGTISVAVYSVGANLKAYYESISVTISNVLTPRIHRMEASGVNHIEMSDLFIKIGRIQFILLSLVCSAFIFFGQPFISIWAGDNYFDSYSIALLLMISATVPLIQNMGVEIQRAKNMHQFRSWLYFFMAIINIIITIPLSQKYDSLGAALGTTFSVVVGHGVIMNWYYEKKIGLDIRRFWKNIFSFTPAFILPIIYGVVINKVFFLYDIISLLFFGFCYVIVFLASMSIFGFNEYEKKLFKNMFK